MSAATAEDLRPVDSLADRDALATRFARNPWPWQVLALALLVAVWWPLSWVLEPWVPTPARTLESMLRLLTEAAFYEAMLVTSRRILTAFILAGVIGGALGISMGLSRRAEQFFAPLVAVSLAVPDPVYISFAILAFGVGERSTDLALVVAVTPFVINIVRSSAAARDRHLDDLASVYRFSRRQRYRDVLFPQLVPAALAAGRTAFALSWKIVVVVEGLSQPVGIGAEILDSFNLLRTRDVFAYAILFTLVMQVVEHSVLRPVQRRALAWRT